MRSPASHLPGARTLRMACLTVLVSIAGCGSSDPIDAHRGEWVFINYWAIWCKPCVHEVPELNALHARTGYTVLGVNYDGELGEKLAAQLDKLAIEFPTLENDPAQRFGVERPQVLPTTLLISPDGDLHRVLIGPQTADTLLAATASGQQQG